MRAKKPTVLVKVWRSRTMDRALTVKGGQLSDKVGEKTALGETKSGSKRVRQRDDVR